MSSERSTPELPSADDGDPTSELPATFSRTVQAVFAAGTVGDTLQRVVDLAVETVDGCDFAGIFVLEGEETTPVGTDPAVTRINTSSGGPAKGRASMPSRGADTATPATWATTSRVP